MSKARELADLGSVTTRLDEVGNTDGALSNRNLIINGAMQVAQRGTSATAGGYVSLDRWLYNTSGGSGTFSQETNANPSETDGIRTYARVNISSSSDYTGIIQRIEDVTKVKSGTVTLSFWAKGTAPVGGLYLFCTQDFGTGGSADVDISGILITSTLTSSWVKYETQVTIPSVDGKTINDGSFFSLAIMQGTNTSSTAYDLNITGVQLEVGDTATPFEHRSYSDEIQRCQRYYSQIYYQYEGTIGLVGNVAPYCPVLPVTMRAAGTITPTNALNGGNVTGLHSSSVQSANSLNTAFIVISTNGTGYGYYLADIAIDAEL